VEMQEIVYYDANFILALLIQEHRQHSAAEKISKGLSEFIGAVSFLTVDELLYAFSKYHINKQMVVSKLQEFIISSNNLICVSNKADIGEIYQYCDLYKEFNLKPRDTMHYFLMRQNRIKLIASFDKDFILNQKKLGIKVINN
jgi:predicted nucleic acid-binding protein